MKSIFKTLSLILVFAFGLTLTINAQTVKESKKEVVEQPFCPVAYLAMNKAAKGDAKYSSIYKGKTYYFAIKDAKSMFDAEPEKYLPKFDGFCPTGLAMGKKLASNPEIFSVYKGSTYLFSNQMAKENFDKDPEMVIKGANKNIAILAKK